MSAAPDEIVHGPQTSVAVLFADISGSSLMYAIRGDTVAYNLTARCLNLMDQEVQQAKGRVAKTVGDGVIAVFETAEAAVCAAVGIQQALDQPDSPLRSEGIHIRIAIGWGRAVLANGDVFGDVVNVTSRLSSYAGPDEIVLSDRTYEELPSGFQESARLLERAVLRGRPSWVQIYEYLWKQEADMTVSAVVVVRAANSTLEVTYDSQVFVVNAETPKLKIGRAGDNDITIEQDVVSRYHADITLRGNKFFLADSSTNGTYLQPDGGELIHVLREDVSLGGSGQIRPGAESAPPITYQVVTG